MLIKAEQKYIRTSPRKLALVADAVRHLSLEEAILQLSFIRKRAAEPLLKLFKQAKANAVNNSKLEASTLKINSLEIKKGATYKRFRPVSRGRSHPIKKRTSHLILVLEGKKHKKSVPSAVNLSKVSTRLKSIRTKPAKLTKEQAKGALKSRKGRKEPLSRARARSEKTVRSKQARSISQSTKIIGNKE